MNRAAAVFLLILAINPAGCALFHRKASPANIENKSVDLHGDISKEPPLEVEAVDSSIINEELVVKVKIHAKTEIDPKEVALSLSMLSAGKVASEQVIGLSELLTGSIRAGETTAVMLKSKKQQATEYQVRCSWGADAKAMLAAKAKGADGTKPAVMQSGIIEGLEVRRIGPGGASALRGEELSLADLSVDTEEKPCREKPCDIYFIVSASLVNHSQLLRFGSIALAAGLRWETAGTNQETPQDFGILRDGEAEASLGNLILEPGAKRKVKLRIDQAVPKLPGGRFTPYIRILQASQL